MAIIIVNIIVFLVQWLKLTPAQNEMLYRSYGLIPREFFLAATERRELLPYNSLTAITSMFLHGGFFHLAGNMLYLWIFGNNVEDSMGHKRFLLFYLLSGVAAAGFQFFYEPLSTLPMIGASGAVSGILGAYLLLYPYARVKTLLVIVIFIKIIELPAILLLTIWFFMQILYSGAGGVAWYAHIGGFIFGLLVVKIFARHQRRKYRRARVTG